MYIHTLIDSSFAGTQSFYLWCEQAATTRIVSILYSDLAIPILVEVRWRPASAALAPKSV